MSNAIIDQQLERTMWPIVAQTKEEAAERLWQAMERLRQIGQNATEQKHAHALGERP